MMPFEIAVVVGLPSLYVVLTVLAGFAGGSLHLSRRKVDALADEHWSVQNRSYHGFQVFQSYLRVGSILLIGLLFGLIAVFPGHGFPIWMLAPLLLFAFLLPGWVGEPFTRRVRDAWGRVDFRPYRQKGFLTFLFVLPIFFLIVAVLLIPREFSLAAIGAILGFAAILILWQAWGAVAFSRWTGTLRPAAEEWVELVNRLADRRGLAPRPRVFVARVAMMNAFAYQTGHAVFFTSPLLEHLDREQIEALTEHELSHLEESRASQLFRICQPLVFLPLMFLSPLFSVFEIPVALLIALAGYFILARLYAGFQRRAEFHADAPEEDEGEDTESARHLGEALTTLYRENLVPATMPQAGWQSHPDLYDRLLALGIEPDFERPDRLNIAPPIGFALLFAFLVALLLIAAWITLYVLGEGFL